MSVIHSPVDPPFEPITSGDRVQHARRILAVCLGWDISQAHLANFLGIDAAIVAALEGDSVAVEVYLIALSEALGVQPQYLVSGAEPMVASLSREARKRWTAVLHGFGAPAVVPALDSPA